MAKRKTTATVEPSTNEPRSQRKKTAEPPTFAVELLQKSGFVMGKGDETNELNVDQSVFVRDFTSKLKSHASEFFNSLQEILQEELRLKWCLLPTTTSTTCKSARNTCQDSLIHLLLDIDTIQEPLSTFLIEKLAELSYSNDLQIFVDDMDKSLACMILSQFRWLNKLINVKNLTTQLLELVKGTPVEVQRDIIAIFPEIIAESEHSTVASALTEILLENNELNNAILDTLVKLVIDSETLMNVRKQVLKTLSSVPIKDLPSVVRFALTELTSEDRDGTINILRCDLIDFMQGFNPAFSSTPITEPNNQLHSEVECSIAAVIEHSLRFEKSLCNAWIKTLGAVQSSSQFKQFDLIILILLCSFPAYEKKVDILIKKQIKNGIITEDLIGTTFHCHKLVLKEYIPTLLNLAKGFLSSALAESEIVSMGSLLYFNCFITFDTFTKQEVVGNLIAHVSNGVFQEIDVALNTLQALVKEKPQKMTSFSIFIKKILDNFSNLTLSHIRKVYQMLSSLAYHGGRDGKMIEDDIMIFVRKQLANGSVKYRKMGVIGALVALTTVSQDKEKEKKEKSTSKKSVDTHRQISLSLLELVYKSVFNTPEALGLLYDELSRIAAHGYINPELQKWIEHHMLSNFKKSYTIDVPSNRKNLDFVDSDFKFGLDGADVMGLNLFNILKHTTVVADSDVEEWGLASFTQCLEMATQTSAVKEPSANTMDPEEMLAVLKKFSSSSTTSSCIEPMKAYPLVLAPNFRLLQMMRKSKGKDISGLKSFLACPILVSCLEHTKFPSLSVQEKHLVLDTLFFCINWFIENINAFASASDKGVEGQVVLRLQFLVELQEMTWKYLPDANNYMPPLADFDWEITDMPPVKISSKKPAAKKKKPTKKKNKKKGNEPDKTQDSRSTDSDSDADNNDEDNDLSSELSDTITSAGSHLQLYIRELDFDVFALLRLGIGFRKRTASSNLSKDDLALRPQELILLLGDLYRKLSHSLVSSFRSRFEFCRQKIGFTNFELRTTDEVIESCTKLLPHFCTLFEDCATYFTDLIAASDGIIDSKSLMTGDSQLICQCMLQILKILNCVFSWSGFTLSSKVDLLKTSLRKLSNKDENIRENNSLQELVLSAVQYLAKFDDAIVSLSCAASLTNLLKIIIAFSQGTKPNKQLSEIAKTFLQHNWIELDKSYKTPTTNPSIQMLLQTYIKYNNSVLEALDHLCEEVLPAIVNPEENGESSSFRTLIKSSFGSYYRVMFISLANELKEYYIKKSTENDDGEHELMQWSLAIKVFHVMINTLKSSESRTFINVSLKHGRLIVEIFLKHGMPLMDKMFPTNRENVINLLKNLQASTRYMQHVCIHSKVLKDMSLGKQVPLLKKTLESFVFRVKVMLGKNKCGEAFWLGNLRNRDLKGEEIASQKVPSDAEDSPKDEENSDLESTEPMGNDVNSSDKHNDEEEASDESD